MNKIYKVIWSKVKHQYVVVSELAHSSGKQSRTARKSLRSRIAALVVCGAIAAFGVYGALPTQQAFAAEEGEISSTAPIGGLANISDYVAYRAPDDAIESTTPPEGYHLVNANNPENPSQKYWVRDGFTVEFGNIPKLDGTDSVFGITNIHAPNNEDVFNQVLTDTVAVNKGTEEYTNIGEELNDVSLENLVGSTNAKNESAAEVPTNYHYYIETSEGQWENVGNTDGKTNFYNHFKTVGDGLVYNEETGKYTYNGVTVSSDNIYYIKDVETNKVNPGVFVDDEGNLYTGTVWGNTGEILATAKDEDGTFKTFWSSIADSDDIYLEDGNVTVGDINNSFSKLIENDKILKRNDIKEITVTPNDDGKGGILGLVRNGVDENGNNIAVDGAITVENVGGTSGKDLGIKFSQKDESGQESAFTVDVGSKVVANDKPSEGSTEVAQSLDSLSINGEYYTINNDDYYLVNSDKVSLSEGVSYGSGENAVTTGYGIDEHDNIDLHVQNADGTTKHVVLTDIAKASDVDNLQFSDAGSVKYDKDDKGNWDSHSVTLSGKVDYQYNDGNTTGGTKLYNVAYADDNLATIENGKYRDTYGSQAVNVDYLNDKIAASQKEMSSQHTTMTVNGGTKAPAVPEGQTEGDYNTDGNLQLKQTNNNGQIQYDVKLNDRIELGTAPAEGTADKRVVVDGNTATVSIGGIDITNENGPYLAVGNSKLKFYEDGGLATGNETGTFSVRPDGDLEISGKNSSFNVDAETGNVNAINSSGSAIMMNDDSVALNASGNGVAISDEGITLNTNGSAVTVDRFNGATFTNTNTTESTNINGATITTGTVKGLKNTTIKYEGFATEGRAATEEQLQQATAASKTTLSNGINTNVTSKTDPIDGHVDYQVNLNDNINLNNRVYINGKPAEGNNTIVDIKSGDTSKEESIFAVEDKGNGSISIGGIDVTNVDGPYLAVGDGKLKFYKDGGLATGNETGTFSVRPDGDLEISGKNSSFNVDAETGNVNAINSSGSAIMMNDDSVALNASGNGVAISDEGITLNTNGSAVTVDRFNGATFTNTNTTESTNINGATITTGTVKGLKNTTIKYEGFATEGRAATEEQLQQATAASKTTLSNGINTNVTSKTDPIDGHVDYQVNLNDNINLNNRVYINGKPAEGNNTIVDIKSGDTSKEESIFAVEDKGNGSISIGGIDVTNVDGPYLAVGDGKLKFYKDGGLATGNETGTFSVRPDGDLEISGKNSSFNVDAETGNVNAINSSGSAIMMNDDSVALNASGNGVAISDEGITLNTNGSAVTVDRFNGATFTNTNTTESTNINGATITTGTVKGLKNTTIKYEGFATEGRAATEEQLQQATAASKTTLSNGINTNVTSKTDPIDGHVDYQVNLNDNINLNNRVYINGKPAEGNNTIVDIKSGDTSKEESIFAVEDKGNGSISIGGIDVTNVDGPYLAVGDGKLKFYKDGGLATGNETGTFSVRPDGDLEISGKNSSFNVDAETGNVNAINSSGSAIMMNDDSVALNASGNGVAISDEGITLNTNGSAVTVDRFNGATFTNTNTTESTNINGANITAGEGENQIKINGAPKADDPALSVGTDKFVVGQDGSLSVSDKFNVDAETGNINAVNSNGSAIMMNDDSVALNASGNGVAISDEGITLNTNGSAVTVDRFNGATFTNTNTGETTNINGDIITTDTVKGLSNTTWDDELAEQVVKSEELQGTAATQGQLLDIKEAVDTVAGQHTEMTVNGGTKAPVIQEGETESAYTDGNLQLKQTVVDGKTTYDIKLNDNITLGNPKADVKNGESATSITLNTTEKGYVPDIYNEDTEGAKDFIDEHGGFMFYATNSAGTGLFGVTTDGMAHAKDFVSYTASPDPTVKDEVRYSLNEIGDTVSQMATYYKKDKEGNLEHSYTVFSHYLNEAEKDKPFETVDKNATRDIPLALRDDGAVLIGATIKGDDFTDNGIRINAEIDDDGNNVATITGLENTTWTPPAPVATFANEGTETSRAATEAQLNDLYGTVVGYNVDTNGVNYGTVTLGGGRTSYDQDTHEGGTVLNNVAYASGNDGSEAVNVDYLKDAINKAVEAGGSISNSDKHLVANTAEGSNGVYKPNAEGNVNLIVSDEKGNSSTVTIGDVASKTELDSLKTNVGDLNYDKVTGDKLVNGDSVTTAIGKLDNKIDNISGTATDAANNTVTGGTIKDDGTISLTQKDGDTVALDGKLTDSGVVQDGTKFDGETGTLTITSQDKYNKGTSSVTVSGIASKDDIGTVKDTIGATSKEDLKDAYKDADKDGNATTEYITDSETMVDADVALDHAVQDVANTSYANDMILSNRIDNVESRLGDVEERIDKVGAMAAAIANLRTMGYDPEAPTEVAVGVGQYKSETGIALGIFHYPNQDFMLSASISTSGDEVMGGIGATWRIGRKTAEEKAKDEEERILAKAEEIKQAAKRAEVKEQAERHAKLLAEREAKGEPIVPVEESAEQAQA